jgi:hypothetical protein
MYFEVDPEAKYDGFNKPAFECADLFMSNKLANANFHVWIMDSVHMRTTNTWLSNHFPAKYITAFTCSESDYSQMIDTTPVELRLQYAEDLYDSEELSHSNHIIIDDGMQTAKNTLDRIRILLKNITGTVGFMSNVSCRGNNSHSHYVTSVKSIARSCGYSTEHKVLNPYRQSIHSQIMRPYWFEFTPI